MDCIALVTMIAWPRTVSIDFELDLDLKSADLDIMNLIHRP